MTSPLSRTGSECSECLLNLSPVLQSYYSCCLQNLFFVKKCVLSEKLSLAFWTFVLNRFLPNLQCLKYKFDWSYDTNMHIHRYILCFFYVCFVSCHISYLYILSTYPQSQASHPSVSAPEWGSGSSAHSGILEGIQGTLDMTRSKMLFTDFLSKLV